MTVGVSGHVDGDAIDGCGEVRPMVQVHPP